MTHLIILNIILILLEVILLLLGANCFFEKRRSTPFLWFSLLPLVAVFVLLLQLFDSIFFIRAFTLVLAAAIWIRLTHVANWVASIFLAVLLQSYLYAGDLCFMFLASSIMGEDLSALMQDPYAFYVMSYMTKCFCLFAFVLVRKWIRRHFRHVNSSWQNWAKTILIPVFVSLISLVLVRILLESPERSKEVILCAVLLVILDFLSVVLLDALEEQEAIRQKQEMLQRNLQQEKQNLELWAEAYRIQRKQSHDFNNHLSVLRGMVEKELPIQEITNYMDRMGQQEVTSGLQISTHRHVTDILFNHKFALAQKHQIRIDLQLDDLSFFPLPDDEMTVVLSNLIDNAINACKAVPEPNNRYIVVKMKKSDQFWFLYVENTTAEPIKIINNQVIKAGVVASPHGYGLENVRTLLDRHEATYAFDYSNSRNAFVVSVQFPSETV